MLSSIVDLTLHDNSRGRVSLQQRMLRLFSIMLVFYSSAETSLSSHATSIAPGTHKGPDQLTLSSRRKLRHRTPLVNANTAGRDTQKVEQRQTHSKSSKAKSSKHSKKFAKSAKHSKLSKFGKSKAKKSKFSKSKSAKSKSSKSKSAKSKSSKMGKSMKSKSLKSDTSDDYDNNSEDESNFNHTSSAPSTNPTSLDAMDSLIHETDDAFFNGTAPISDYTPIYRERESNTTFAPSDDMTEIEIIINETSGFGKKSNSQETELDNSDNLFASGRNSPGDEVINQNTTGPEEIDNDDIDDEQPLTQEFDETENVLTNVTNSVDQNEAEALLAGEEEANNDSEESVE